jgi:hypothetical protein
MDNKRFRGASKEEALEYLESWKEDIMKLRESVKERTK